MRNPVGAIERGSAGGQSSCSGWFGIIGLRSPLIRASSAGSGSGSEAQLGAPLLGSPSIATSLCFLRAKVPWR